MEFTSFLVLSKTGFHNLKETILDSPVLPGVLGQDGGFYWTGKEEMMILWRFLGRLTGTLLLSVTRFGDYFIVWR